MKKFLLFFIVLISIIIYFATFQSRENARLFKQMCENKEYRIEIVDGNYTASDIYNDGYDVYIKIPKNTKKFYRCIDDKKCTKPVLINAYDVYLRKSDRLIAKVYNVVKPLSSLSVALNFETGNNKTFCGYGAQSIELFDFLINNAKGEKNE